MNTVYSKSYYEENSDRLSQRREAINPDKDLAYKMQCIDRTLFPESALVIIEKTFAEEVASRIEKELTGKKTTYINVRRDRTCLGMTSAIQEVHEARRIIQMFEYNCFRLSEFKKRYSL